MNLITGATGILGSHLLLRLLQRNEPVMAIRQKSSDPNKVLRLFTYYTSSPKELYDKIQWVDADICDIFSLDEAMKQASRVFHCAGYVSLDKRKRKALFRINEQGTANVVNACLRANLPLCHVSSVATLHNLDHRAALTENVFWKRSGKESDYAISKYNAEREVWRGMEEGLKAVIVNPGVILSAGFWEQSSSRIFNTCYKGNLFYTEGKTGYVAAEDVAEVMIRLMEKQQYANRYIIVEGNYGFREIFELIQTCFGKPAPKIKAGKILLRLAVIGEGIKSFFTGKEPALTRSVVNAALNKQELSNAKIVSTLNYNFLPVKEVISGVCAHYLRDKAEKGS